jgi:hypothetical protein
MNQYPKKDQITIDTILDWFQQSIETKTPIGPQIWIHSALKLNILKSELDDQIAEYEFQLAQAVSHLIEEGCSSAKAEKIKINKIDYKDYLVQKAKEKRVLEFIRLSKKQAQLISQNNHY